VAADEEPEGPAAPEPVVADEELAGVDDADVVESAAVEPEAAGAAADEVAVLLAEWLRAVCGVDAECDLAVCARPFAPDAAVCGDRALPWLRSRRRATATHTAPNATAARIHLRDRGSRAAGAVCRGSRGGAAARGGRGGDTRRGAAGRGLSRASTILGVRTLAR
jgi:hypothetical protein